MVSLFVLPADNVLTIVPDAQASYTTKPLRTSFFGQRESRAQKESRIQREIQVKKENQMQVIESIMGRIRKEDRARVGELILLWRGKVQDDDKTTALTHVKVRSLCSRSVNSIELVW
jgi:hypothetical protein